MQEVEFTDWHKEDACAKVERLFDEIVDMGELEAELYFPVRPAFLTDAMLDLDLGCELDVFRDIRIDERDEPLLIEVVMRPPYPFSILPFR